MAEAGPSQPPAKRIRTSTACEVCRKKRAKCDGVLPSCRGCTVSGVVCIYDLQGDRRKPYTKDVVVALQMRVDALEKELADVRSKASAPESRAATPGLQAEDGPSLLPKNAPQAALQGGLALNCHGELRFFGPTSSYRAVLAESRSPPLGSSVQQILTKSLTHASHPTVGPAEPTLPRRPPDLQPAFQSLLIRLAFEFCFSQFGLVQEREFYRDMAATPWARTHHYSPFLLNVVLAIGSRYIDIDQPYPIEICGDLADPSTRGDAFVSWARYLLDQEWLGPKTSTVTALVCLSLYLAGRGLDGPCWMYCGQAMRLCEDFGLNLGIHRLAIGSGSISEELVAARRHAFYAAFSQDVLISIYIGRSARFTTDDIDLLPPPASQELDADIPKYRSTTYHLSAHLMLLASRVMSIYAVKPGVSLEARKSEMAEIHLKLETWYHDLPAIARAAMTGILKAPHPHVIQLNLTYYLIMIILHRPFLRRLTLAKTCDNLSTEKCLASAKHIVRLVKLQKEAHGLRFTAPAFQHAAFCAGTILALSAVEDQISETPEKDAERREQAQTDLRYVVNALREVGETWSTANTSAQVLEALLTQWGTEPVVEGDVELDPALWQPTFDTSSSATFPFMFPSWDLDPAGLFSDFMTHLNPLPDLPTLYQPFEGSLDETVL